MSEKCSDKKSEIACVSKRVESKKKEIDHLEAELQKLISTGISNANNYLNDCSKTVPTASNKENFDKNSIELGSSTSTAPRITSSNVLFKEAGSKRQNINIQAPYRPVPHITITGSNPSPIKLNVNRALPSEETKRSCKYNKQAAREYIKKQKEKRLEAAKAAKDAQNAIAIKKQKLIDLHQKSLQLVTKNVALKRKRSRSRETNDEVDNAAKDKKLENPKSNRKCTSNLLVTKCAIPRNSKADYAKHPETSKEVHRKSLKSSHEIKKFNHPQLKNVTIRKKSPSPKNSDYENDEVNIAHINSQVPGVSKYINKNDKALVAKQNKAATMIQAFYRGYHQRKLYVRMIEKRKYLQKTKDKYKRYEDSKADVKQNVSINIQKPEIPQCLLHTSGSSNPYNFINTVKRKLNLVIGSHTPIAKTDVAVQSSLTESSCKTPTQEIFEKTKNDIKLLLEKSSKSSNLKSPLKTSSIKPFEVSVSHKSEKSKVLSDKSNKLSKRIDNSDSDTSKNIPAISSESSITSDRYVNTLSKVKGTQIIPHQELENVKRTKSPSEYKLPINTEALRNLKLRRTQAKDLDNTVFAMHNIVSSSEIQLSKKLDNPGVMLQSTLNVERETTSQIPSKLEKAKSEKLAAPSEDEKIEKANSNGNQNHLGNNTSNCDDNVYTISKNDIISYNTSNYSTQKSLENVTADRMNSKEINEVSDNGATLNDTRNLNHLTTFQEYMRNINVIPNTTDDAAESNRSMKGKLQVAESSAGKTDIIMKKLQNKTELDALKPIQNHLSDAYSSNFTEVDSASLPSLTRPSVALEPSQTLQNTKFKNITRAEHNSEINIAVRRDNHVMQESEANSNQIHLKIEAELHLLNDFNESLRKYVELEKSVLELKNQNKYKENTFFKNCDTQTSLASHNSHNWKPSLSNSIHSKVNNQLQNINYSRGSEITENISLNASADEYDTEKELALTGFELSSLQNVSDSTIDQTNVEESIVANENYKNMPYVGLSLGMFEQLIKDEDTRIENLKTILKIREKALLDRTKGEITWLEIQKKHLKETGQLHEISQLKKKQRGILMRLQHEYHEMQTLKHMQKIASKERKAVLKRQRNMIKSQLSTDNMLTKVKLNTPRDSQRNSGPFKVYNIRSHSESIRSETSISRNSAGDEIVSVTSHSIMNRVSDLEVNSKDRDIKLCQPLAKAEKIQRSLLMREAALQKRRKAAEELLQWHQKLKEEERKVAELEMLANSIINEVSKTSVAPEARVSTEHTFQGTQLNLLWQNMTGREDKKFNDHETYPLSQIGLKRLCKDAKRYANKNCLEKNNKISDKSCNYDSIDSDLDYCSDTSSVINTNLDNKNNKSESANEGCNKLLDSSKVDSDATVISSHKTMSNNYSFDFDEPFSLNNKENTNAASEKSCKSSERISSITELIDNLTKTHDETLLSSSRSVLSKSMDTEIEKNETANYKSTDNETSSCEDRKQYKTCNNKVEMNKHLLLKESLHTENSRALLDNIESLKSSIQKITSKSASKLRSSRFNQKANESTSPRNISSRSTIDSDVSDLNSNITASLDSQFICANDLQKISNIDAENDKLKVKDNALPYPTSNNSNSNSLPKLANEDILTEIPEALPEKDADISEDIRLSASQPEYSIVPDIKEIIISEVKSANANSEPEEHSSGAVTDDSSLHFSTCEQNKYSMEASENEEDSLSGKTPCDEDNTASNAIEECDFQEVADTNCTDNHFNKSSLVDSVQTDMNTVELESHSCILDIDNSAKVSEKEQGIKDAVAADSVDENSNVEDVQQVASETEEFHDKTGIETALDISYGIIVPKDSLPQSGAALSEKVDTEPSNSCKSESENLTCDQFTEISSVFSDEKIEEKIKIDFSEPSETKLKCEDSKNAQNHKVDVKKRVLEILADANSPRGDNKSPRLQDLYVTTYDVASPGSSPELCSPSESNEKDVISPSKKLYGNEAEELLKKQLAIEQEIKQLEQQQKGQIPYLFVREIPNKPPPPYKPPVSVPVPTVASVLPSTVEHITAVTPHIANILYNAYLADTLDSASLDDKCDLFDKNIDKSCARFLFDISKELAIEHYAQFKVEQGPSWMQLTKKTKLSVKSSLNENGLVMFLNNKLKQLFAFEKIERRENSIIKWSRKKRDHVDEILVLESQDEEVEWTNYDKDELYVKNEVTTEIMNILLNETAEVLSNVLKKRISNC